MDYAVKAFVAEESEKLRKFLVHLIDRFTGLTISGSEGDAYKTIQAIRRLKPDVVILSMQMSNGTAMDVLKNIKTGKENPTIILLIDQIHTAKPGCFEKYGIKHIFNKALELEELVKALKQISNDNLETS